MKVQGLKISSRDNHPEYNHTKVKPLIIGEKGIEAVIGGNGHMGIIAGPCVVQSYEQTLELALAAKEAGAVVIAVVTMPFECEKARIEKAEFGLQELRDVVYTVIVIDNNRLVDIAGQLPIQQAFAVANELISTMIKGIVETITLPSLINLDYADVSAVMKKGEVAVIGIGESDSSDS